MHRFALALVLLSACVDDAPELAVSASAIVNSCRYASFYSTVNDLRRCDTGGYFTGAYIANAMGAPALVPAYAANDTYRVYAPTAGHGNGKLLVYLAGGGADNTDKEQVLERAAYDGYHVIAVRYWNDDGGGIETCGAAPDVTTGAFPPRKSCDQLDDPSCQPYDGTTDITFDECAVRFFLNSFANYLTPDTDYAPAYISQSASTRCSPGNAQPLCAGTTVGRNLNKGDAALMRARLLLRFLAANMPNADWDTFAGASGYDARPYLDWAHVALMGHSEGSKIMFHVAHDGPQIFGAVPGVTLDRVILLSGPNLPLYTRPGKLPDSYVTSAGATPLDRIYAFSNAGDPKVDDAKAVWQGIGLPGAAQPFETRTWRFCIVGQPCGCGENPAHAPPHGSTARALIYSGDIAACTGNSVGPHSSTTDNESCSDVDDPNTCWYRNVWDYMLTN